MVGPIIAYGEASGGRLNPHMNLVFNSVKSNSERAPGVVQAGLYVNGWHNLSHNCSIVRRVPVGRIGWGGSTCALTKTVQLANKHS